MHAISFFARRAFTLLHLIALFIIPLFLLACAGGCAALEGSKIGDGKVGPSNLEYLDIARMAATAYYPGAAGLFPAKSDNAGIPPGYRIVWDTFDSSGALVDLAGYYKMPRLEQMPGLAPLPLNPGEIGSVPVADAPIGDDPLEAAILKLLEKHGVEVTE